MAKKGWNRRDLLKVAALAPVVGGSRSDDAADRSSPPGEEPRLAATEMEKRPFGRTREKVTLLGIGGVYFARRGGDEETAFATIRRALERGITYFDTASQYGNGLSEERIGKVLAEDPPRRDRIFLATKTLERSYETSRKEIDASLKRLRVEHVDLLQVHAINDAATLDQVTGRDGSLRAALEAQTAGKTRYVGITGHTRPSILVRALERHPFDSVLVPLGPADVHVGDFLRELVPVARKQGAAVVAMKVLAAGRSVGQLPVADCLRYAMSLPVATTIVGMATPEEVDQNVETARTFRPMSPKLRTLLEDRARPLGTADTLWWKRT